MRRLTQHRVVFNHDCHKSFENDMIRTTIAAAMLVFPVSLPSVAQDYPTKPIEIIVPSSAGGSTDATARIFGEIAEQKFPGVKFVVQNIDGS